MAKIQTTIKIDEDVYGQFKVIATKTHQKLQTVSEKLLFLYVANHEFRNTVDGFELSPSGSI